MTKRILMLTDGWRRLVTTGWTTGFMQYVREKKKDMALWQFNSWGNWNRDRLFNAGQYSILDLPDLSQYDGILVDATNIIDREVLSALLEKVRTSGLPAVSVCFETPGIHYVGADGRRAVQEIIEHLVKVHGCRTFHFVGGPDDQFESEIRRTTFLDCMKEHGIPEENYDATCGDFTAENGRKVIQSYFPDQPCQAEDGRDLPVRPIPDVFVCANDNIAVGIILELETHGWSCPEDVRVTGFDDLDKAAYFDPQITTAALNREQIGYESARVLDLLLQNRDAKQEIFHIPHENCVQIPVIPSESCGCENSGRVNYRDYLKWQVTDSITRQDEEMELAEISARLSAGHTLKDLVTEILRVYTSRDCDGVYIVADDRLELPTLEKKAPFSPKAYDREHLRLLTFREKGAAGDDWLPEGKAAGDNERLPEGKAAAGKDGTDSLPENAPAAALTAYLRSRDRGCSFFTMALHLSELPVGYILLKNPRFMIREWRFYQVQDQILTGLKNWYSNRQLEASVRRLSEIYDRDQLTGLYARTVFHTKLYDVFQTWQKAGLSVAVYFADIDRFKQINDDHGHDYGDRILMRTAKIINRNLPAEGFAVRYGGDEFVAACPVADTGAAEAIRTSILQQMQRLDTGVSIGMVLTSGKADDTTDFDAYIRRADKAMYEEKELHHEGNDAS